MRSLIAAIALLLVLAPSALAAAPTPAPAGGDHAMPGMSGGATPTAPTPATPAPVTVRVGRRGFDGMPGGLKLQVRAGERVTLNFVYDDADLSEDNPHIISIQGYNLRTPEINRANPRATLTFDATETGTFEVRCVATCEGHGNLRGGSLVVGGEGQAAPASGTVLELRAFAGKAREGTVTAVAALRDAAGQPVPGAKLRFFQKAQFFTANQVPVLIGQASTGPDGTATITFAPRREGALELNVRYEGSPRYAPSEAATAVTVAVANPGYVMKPRGLALPYLGNYWMWLVVVGVWSTYAIVVYNLYRIRQEGA